MAPLEAVGYLIRAVVGNKFDDVPIAASSRVKTVDTIIDKLRRRTSLSSMQDIVGFRLVGDMNLAQQDALVRALAVRFPGAKTTDRRITPMHGYRAVHVVVEVDERPVEIQVRTDDQDFWAQVMEELADDWGRGIRYGEPPNGPPEVASARAAAIAEWARLSRLFALSEEVNVSSALASKTAMLLHARAEAGDTSARPAAVEALREAADAARRSADASRAVAAALSGFSQALRLELK